MFVWPPRPLAVLKWLLGYPGFLWPWNSVYLLITLVTGGACNRAGSLRHVSAGWIADVPSQSVLLWLTAGGWHLLLYTFKVQGTERKYDPRWLNRRSPLPLPQSALR